MNKTPLLLLLLALWAAPGHAQADAPAVLVITSTPPGATVALDHRIQGTAPLRLEQIPPGEHHLRVSAGPDYKPFTRTISLRPGENLEVEAHLEAVTGLLLKDGVAAARAGRVQEALPLLTRAVEGTPRRPEAWWWIGRLRVRRGELAEARQAFRSYADFYPQKPELYLYLGSLHERLGDLPAAVTAYKLALLKTPDLKDALQDPPAATWENVAKAGTPSSPAEQLRLAWLYEQKGRMADALRWLKAAVQTTFGDWQDQELEDLPPEVP